MSVNSSGNDLLQSNLSSFPPSGIHCYIHRPGSIIFILFFITNVLSLVPACILVLYLGLKRRCLHCSTSTAATSSHVDIFTCHLVAMELFGFFGCVLVCLSIHTAHLELLYFGLNFYSITWYGELFFQLITCVERYLAAVHPITYRSLRSERGIRLRNVTIGCVWLLSLVAAVLMGYDIAMLITEFCLLLFSLIVISFCSLSVFWVLTRPRPGEQNGDSVRVDQSKQRASYTIMGTLGLLLLKCVMNLGWVIARLVDGNEECMTVVSEIWFNLPSNLLLPLQFLFRARILPFCKSNTR